MHIGIIFLAAINVMIFSQLIVQAADKNKKHREIVSKLDSILEKIK